MLNSINNLFNNIAKQADKENNITIVEEDSGATTKEVIFKCSTNSFEIKNDILKKGIDLFSEDLLKKNCDGIIIEKDKIVFVELKSKLFSDTFDKAIKQIEDSIIKVYMYLSPIEKKTINNYQVYGILAFQKPNTEIKDFALKCKRKKYCDIILNKKVEFEEFHNYQGRNIKQISYSLLPIQLDTETGQYILEEVIK